MVISKIRISTLLIAAATVMVLIASQSVSALGESAQIYLKGCKNGDTVQFFVDNPNGGNKQTISAESNIYSGGRALETVVNIPDGYTTTDVLIAECSKGTLATLIAPATAYCAPQDGLGIYQEFASRGNKFCLKVRTIL